MPSETAVEVVDPVAAAEVEADEETAGIGVAAEEVAARPKIKIKTKPLGEVPSTKEPNTRTCQPESGPGARYISNTGKMLIFVLNQQVVLGRMYLDREIETVTSSVNNTSCLMTH